MATSPMNQTDSAKNLGLIPAIESPKYNGSTMQKRLLYNEIDQDQYDISFVL